MCTFYGGVSQVAGRLSALHAGAALRQRSRRGESLRVQASVPWPSDSAPKAPSATFVGAIGLHTGQAWAKRSCVRWSERLPTPPSAVGRPPSCPPSLLGCSCGNACLHSTSEVRHSGPESVAAASPRPDTVVRPTDQPNEDPGTGLQIELPDPDPAMDRHGDDVDASNPAQVIRSKLAEISEQVAQEARQAIINCLLSARLAANRDLTDENTDAIA